MLYAESYCIYLRHEKCVIAEYKHVYTLGQTSCVTNKTFWIIFVKRDLIQVNNMPYFSLAYPSTD